MLFGKSEILVLFKMDGKEANQLLYPEDGLFGSV